jgi:hypothetical protein
VYNRAKRIELLWENVEFILGSRSVPKDVVEKLKILCELIKIAEVSSSDKSEG